MAEGDQVAFEQLMRSMVPLAVKYAKRISFDPQALEENAAQFRLVVCRAVRAWRWQEGRLSSYVGRSLRNASCDKASATSRKLPTVPLDNIAFNLESTNPDVADEVCDRDDHHRMIQRIRAVSRFALKKREREVFFAHVRGNTFAEIALDLGLCNRQRAKQIYDASVIKMREAMVHLGYPSMHNV